MHRRSLLKGMAGGAGALALGNQLARFAGAQEASPTPGGPVTVNDARGEVTLPQPAERVVATEWVYVENLLALGLQPAGVADIEGYKAWVDIDVELAEDVPDVGTRQEPSIESIAAIGPDLIVGPLFRLESVADTLSSIAPTLLFNPYPTDESISQYEEMLETFRTMGTACGRPTEAEQTLTTMQDAFDSAKERLVESGLEGASFVLAQAFTYENTPTIRLFLDNAMATEELVQIGLTNAFEGSPDPYGFNTVGVEALVEVQDANFIYIVQDEDDIFANQLAENPVWSNLAFVQEGCTYRLGGDTWTFGGPLSAITFVNRVADALTQ